MPLAPKRTQPTFDIADTQSLRRARELLRRKRVARQADTPNGTRRYAVTERGQVATVTVDPLWRHDATCDCYAQVQHARFRIGDPCKHIVAVLGSDEELKCQIIELLL